MVEDKGLQVTSLEEKWEVRIKQGRTVKDIRKLITDQNNSLLQPNTTGKERGRKSLNRQYDIKYGGYCH